MGVLGRVIVLSQFSRNIHRMDDYPGRYDPSAPVRSAKAFENDASARRLANWAIVEGLRRELRHYEKSFLYMPFVHSEELADQDRAIQLFAEQQAIAIAGGRRRP